MKLTNKKYDWNIKGMIKNILFFKEIKKSVGKEQFKNFHVIIQKVLNDPKMYERIKNIVMDTVITSDKNMIGKVFRTLETQYGFDSFQKVSDKKIKDYVKGFGLFGTEYNVVKSHIIDFDNDVTCINASVLLLLEYMNACTFMPIDVFNKISDKDVEVINMKDNDNVINSVYLLNDDHKELLNPLSVMANLTVLSLKELLDRNDDVKVDLMIFGIDSKKVFPDDKGSVIDDNDVNSGDTIPKSMSLHRPLIRLYRLEEINKVLIHEMIHATTFDKDIQIKDKYPYKVFHTKYGNHRLYEETITEVIAEMINCVVHALKDNRPIDEVVKKEVEFGMIQTAKILNHFGFSSVDDFLDDNNTKKIVQSTAVFEYFIPKTILLYRFDEFITIIKEKGGDIDKLIHDTIMTDQYYIKKVNTFINNLGQLSDDLKRTFRMTICDDISDDMISKQVGGLMINDRYRYIKYKRKCVCSL